MDWLLFREPVSAWTHGVWLLLALPATWRLWRAGKGDPRKRLGLLVFGLTASLCFGASMLYHAVRLPPDQIDAFATLDRIGIYFFIAGTVTPVALVVLPGAWQWSTLGVAWLLAAGGTGLCLAYGAAVPSALGTSLYLAMGWGTLGCYVVLARALSHRQLQRAVVGGVCYSVGAILNLLHWPVLYPGVLEAHEVFHLFVMAGSLAHFRFMLKTVAPYDRRAARTVEAEPTLAGASLEPILLSRPIG